MKAQVLTGIREMEMTERPMPTIKRPTHVRLKLKVAGVCGSDVHYYTTGRIGEQVVSYPFTVGHECSAMVEAVGPEVDHVKVGDRVAVEPAISCWQCDQCKAGRPHTCRKLRFLGCPGQIEGCLSEYIVMPQECCYVIPDDMTMEQAALSEPLSIGMYGVHQSIDLAGAAVGILGAGPIGLSVMLPAKARGARRVYVSDLLDYRCDLAAANGADLALNPETSDVVDAVTQEEPGLLDVVFECCGKQEALDQALQLLKPGGKLMLIGIPEFERFSFQADIARRKEICIQHVRRQNECVQPALDCIHNKDIEVDFMVTHRFDFQDTPKAFDLVDRYEGKVVKAMIQFD